MCEIGILCPIYLGDVLPLSPITAKEDAAVRSLDVIESDITKKDSSDF